MTQLRRLGLENITSHFKENFIEWVFFVMKLYNLKSAKASYSNIKIGKGLLDNVLVIFLQS